VLNSLSCASIVVVLMIEAALAQGQSDRLPAETFSPSRHKGQ